MSSENNKRIAKNTAMLYIRMLITMAVTLYTSRIVLNTLGVEDFGIYNVVGGIITMIGFLNSSMSAATQRFLSFEIGKKDENQLKKVFSMSVNIHLAIATLILVIAETIGLWFVNNQLNIPINRMIAANWVYQFSILAFITNIISVPYNALIISHERMNVFAWVSIIEVSLLLLTVFMLQMFGFDRLILYAILISIVTLIIRIVYGIYCRLNFPESKYMFFIDKLLYKTLMSYAGWTLIGSAAGALNGQGINILLNIFFGPSINAARGIAYQVRSAVNRFVYNFQVAMNPQIIKSFAFGDIKYMHQLIFQGAKYSFFLLFLLSLPILLETETILKLWLKIVPEYTIIFTQLIIINILIDSIAGPLMTAAQASGRIKLYQGAVGSLLLMILPISYLFLKLGYPPQVTLWINILISIIALFVRLIIVNHLVNLSMMDYAKNVILPIVSVSCISIIIPYAIYYYLPQSFMRFLTTSLVSLLSVLAAIYWAGLRPNEQYFVKSKLAFYVQKISYK